MSEKTAAQIAAEMKARKTSNSSPIANFFGLTVSSGDESSGDEGDGSPLTLGSQPVEQPVVKPQTTTEEEAKKVAIKEGEEEAGRVKEGGVMHWLGLAGGRKRRRKKSRKKKKSKKRKSRRKKRRKSKKRKSRRRKKSRKRRR